jgi:U3 small nucleolar RNA-associated protein 15
VLRGGSYRYFLRGQSTTAHAEDVAVETGSKPKLRAYDVALKRFEYGAALDSALATGNVAIVTRWVLVGDGV